MPDINIDAIKYEVDFYTCDSSIYVGGGYFNSLTFINNGTTIAKIESINLQPGQSFEITGNVGEVTNQRFFVNFGSSTIGNNVVVIRKRYLNV